MWNMGDRESLFVTQRCLRALVRRFGDSVPSKVKWSETTLNTFSRSNWRGLEKNYIDVKKSTNLAKKVDEIWKKWLWSQTRSDQEYVKIFVFWSKVEIYWNDAPERRDTKYNKTEAQIDRVSEKNGFFYIFQKRQPRSAWVGRSGREPIGMCYWIVIM